jgi:hypothetical protein
VNERFFCDVALDRHSLVDAGVNRRKNAPTAEENSFKFDAIVTKFLVILQSRLKKSIWIVIQIFVVMQSTEAESEQLLSALHDVQFAVESICQQEMVKHAPS